MVSRPWAVLCVVLVLVQISSIKGDKCEGLEYNGIHHKRDILGKGLDRPYQLSYYKPHIFFSQNIGDDNVDTFEIVSLNETTKAHHVVHGMKNGFATAVHHASHVVYFGASDGVYRKEYNSKKNMTHIVHKHNVWDLFFKDHLYIISFPKMHLFKYEHVEDETGKLELQDWVKSKIYQFAIDGDGDVFLTNKTGLYMIKKGEEHHSHKWHQFKNESKFQAIEIDRKGVAHFGKLDGVYVASKSNYTLEKVAHIKNLFSLTFDNENNLIYSNPHQIVKLTPCTDSKKPVKTVKKV